MARLTPDELVEGLVDAYLERPTAQHGDPELAKEEVTFILSAAVEMLRDNFDMEEHAWQCLGGVVWRP